jgi:hypothetical protein
MNSLSYELIQEGFILDLQEELKKFQDFLSKYREKHPVLIQVAEKACEWRADETKKMWLYAMFSYQPRAPLHFYSGFLGCLRSFLINACLDDSGFTIKWMESKFGEDGVVAPVETSKDSEFAMPVVVEDFDGDNDPALLLEAMEEREKREIARVERIHNEQAFLDEFMERIRQ